MTSRRQTIKVIGIGSPFGDDRLGWVAIDLLKQQQIAQKCKHHLILESCDRPGIQLIEIMRGSDKVIIIDAVKSNKVDVGTLHYLKYDEVSTVNDDHLSSHAFGVGQALQLAKALGELPQSFIFYGLEIDDKNTGDTLSQVVQQNLHHLIACLTDKILCP